MTSHAPSGTAGAPPQGKFRRMFSRLVATPAELEAEELREDASSAGGTPIGTCGDREQVTLCGTLRTVTLRPRGGRSCLPCRCAYNSARKKRLRAERAA